MSLGSAYFKIKVLLLLVIIPFAATYELSGVMAFGCFILDFLYVLSHRSSKIAVSVLITVRIFLFWNLFIFVWFDFKGYIRVIQYLCVAMAYYSTCCLEPEYIDYKFVRNVILLQLILYVAWWPVSGFVTNYYSAFYTWGNFLGGILLSYAVILVFIQMTSHTKHPLLFCVMYGIILFLLVISNSRSTIVSLLIFAAGSFVLYRLKGRGAALVGAILLIGVIVVAFLFTVIYPQLLGTTLGSQIELFSREFFNKNFFSGREEIWKIIEDLIAKSPYVGYGLDKTPSSFYDTEFSSHNLWLQTGLQSGLIGVAVLVVYYLNAIRLTIHKHYLHWRLAVAFGSAFIIHECFEVSLTQNNFAIGLPVWFILGLITIESNKYEEYGIQTRDCM